MAAHACLKNEFTEDEKYQNLMTWLNLSTARITICLDSLFACVGDAITDKVTKYDKFSVMKTDADIFPVNESTIYNIFCSPIDA